MTDPRVGAALERAAERVATMRTMYDAKYSARIEQIAHLEGWADAVRALVKEHLGVSRTGAARCKHCKRGWCPARDAIAKFCDTMLGGSDE